MTRSQTWTGHDIPVPPLRIGAAGWVRALARGLVMSVVTFGGLLLLLLVRAVERPLHGLHRPWTPHITQFVCRTDLRILGLTYIARGERMAQPGAVVANHSSWLDIFALNAAKRVYFVSKDEVSRWPGIGWLARATGTVFIRRDARDAAAQKRIFEDRLKAGHKLLFFPEGTSTDGLRVLPFKPTLFAAFFADGLKDLLWVQPVTVIYRAPTGENSRFYGWWGDMDFGSHFLKTLAAAPQGSIEVIWHEPMKVSDFPDRKALAQAAEARVRAGHALAGDD